MVQKYQTIYIQAYVLCISEQKLDRHLEGKAACYKNLRSADDPTEAYRGLICDWYRIGLSLLHSVQIPIPLKQELDIEANTNLFKLF